MRRSGSVPLERGARGAAVDQRMSTGAERARLAYPGLGIERTPVGAMIGGELWTPLYWHATPTAEASALKLLHDDDYAHESADRARVSEGRESPTLPSWR